MGGRSPPLRERFHEHATWAAKDGGQDALRTAGGTPALQLARVEY